MSFKVERWNTRGLSVGSPGMLYTGTTAPIAAGNIMRLGNICRSDGRVIGVVDPSGVHLLGQKSNKLSVAAKSTVENHRKYQLVSVKSQASVY
jgi:hypothetical protein